MQPLAGIRVLDLSQNLAGPFCAQILADLGAEVIKVEPPRGDASRAWGPPFWEGESPLFLSVNRNKRSMTLDLKTDAGKGVLERLIARADVFIQAFRPGAIDRLGFSAEAVLEAHPRLIYLSISPFGPTGPLKDLPGYDALAQAYGGLMSVTGHTETPPTRVGTSIVDLGTGMWGAISVLAALRDREKTGKGTHLVASLLDTAVNWVGYHLLGFLATGEKPVPQGSGLQMMAPYQAFPTSDGHLMIAVGNDAIFERLCVALGLEDLVGDERFRDNPSRVEHEEELVSKIEHCTRARTTRELTEQLSDHKVPSAPIHDIGDVAHDPQVEANGIIPEVFHPRIQDYRQIAFPVRFDGERTRAEHVPPQCGEHTEEIVDEIGFEPEEIASLRAEGAFG